MVVTVELVALLEVELVAADLFLIFFNTSGQFATAPAMVLARIRLLSGNDEIASTRVLRGGPESGCAGWGSLASGVVAGGLLG